MFKYVNGETQFAAPGLCVAEADEGGDGGGGGGGDMGPKDPRVKALVEKAVGEAVAGLKRKNDELLGKLKDLSASAKTLESLGGEDGIKALLAMKETIENDADLRLFAAGKREEYDQRVAARTKAAFEKELEAAKSLLTEAKAENDGLKSALTTMKIDSQIRDVAGKAAIMPSAVDDALYRARRIFSLGENGELVARSEQGDMVVGKTGKGSMTPAEWLENMKQSAPHWWPPSNGGGAGGSRGVEGAGRIVSITDQQGLNSNIEAIAKGEVSVAD